MRAAATAVVVLAVGTAVVGAVMKFSAPPARGRRPPRVAPVKRATEQPREDVPLEPPKPPALVQDWPIALAPDKRIEPEAPTEAVVEGLLTIPRSDSISFELRLEPEDESGESRTEWVRANAPFRFERVRAGSYRAVAELPTHQPISSRLVVPQGASHVSLQLSYQPAETIAGRVFDYETEDPLGGVLVTLRPARDPTAPPRTTWSDSNGQFRFDGLDLTSYGLLFERDGFFETERSVRFGSEDVEAVMIPRH
jgi:hypothetical protein